MNPTKPKAGGGGRFRAEPDRALGPFVVEYWAKESDLAALGGFEITPDCFGELICSAGGVRVVDDDGARAKLPPCALIGLLDRPLRIEAAGVVRCMAARLRPWAVGQLSLGRPDGAALRWADASGVFGTRLGLVLELVERGDWPALVDAFDEALLAETAHWESGPDGIDLAGEFVGDSRRPTGVVAGERFMTGRQVERKVRSLTRTSPKRLACLARFQGARDAIWADPGVDLARLAAALGYSDQPHLTREFRRFSGRTPARFARDSALEKARQAARDVAFVQEPDPAGG